MNKTRQNILIESICLITPTTPKQLTKSSRGTLIGKQRSPGRTYHDTMNLEASTPFGNQKFQKVRTANKGTIHRLGNKGSRWSVPLTGSGTSIGKQGFRVDLPFHHDPGASTPFGNQKFRKVRTANRGKHNPSGNKGSG
jgi:hypothetical protein